MPIELMKTLMSVVKVARGLHSNVQSTEAMETLLHTLSEQSASLARIEAALGRLGNAPFHIGLADLDDANAPDRSEAERYHFLSKARESGSGTPCVDAVC